MEVNIITQKEFDSFKSEIKQHLTKLIEEKFSGKLNSMLRTSEVCEILNISQSTLQNLRNSGKFPYKKLNGTIIYSREDIELFLKELPGG